MSKIVQNSEIGIFNLREIDIARLLTQILFCLLYIASFAISFIRASEEVSGKSNLSPLSPFFWIYACASVQGYGECPMM